MTSTEVRRRSDQYRQQMSETVREAMRAPQTAMVKLMAELIFAFIEIGGEVCAQLAELREAVERASGTKPQ